MLVEAVTTLRHCFCIRPCEYLASKQVCRAARAGWQLCPNARHTNMRTCTLLQRIPSALGPICGSNPFDGRPLFLLLPLIPEANSVPLVAHRCKSGHEHYLARPPCLRQTHPHQCQSKLTPAPAPSPHPPSLPGRPRLPAPAPPARAGTPPPLGPPALLALAPRRPHPRVRTPHRRPRLRRCHYCAGCWRRLRRARWQTSGGRGLCGTAVLCVVCCVYCACFVCVVCVLCVPCVLCVLCVCCM